MKMTMLKVLTTAILISFVLCGFAAAKPEVDAQKSAEQWLSLVDAGKFSESWNTASDYFKSNAPKEQWTKSLKAVRKTLGNVIGRKLKDARSTRSLPGAPDSQYVILHFDTYFGNQRLTVETITLSLDKDNKWRVSAYDVNWLIPREHQVLSK